MGTGGTFARRRGEPETESAVVIGAGAAGLAAAGALAQHGVYALVVDAADQVAASWRTRYDRLRLNTTRRLSSLPGQAIPASAGRWVTRDDFVSYLEDYARRQVPRLSLGVRVESLDLDGGGWRVTTDRGTLLSSAVVVATGFDRDPKLPDWPGRKRYAGNLVHSSDYRNPDPFRDRDVLVIGAGTSGNEIAVDLLGGGARSVRIAIRSRPTTFPREWHGVPIAALAHLFPGRGPASAMDVVGRLLERAVWGDLRRFGLEPPPLGIGTSTERKGHGLAVDSGLIDAIAAGRIEPLPGVDDLWEDGAVLAGGRLVRADAIVAATGFSTGLDSLLGDFPGVLRADGRPAIVGAQQAAAAPGLHLIGYRQPVSGQLPEVHRDAVAVARAVAERARAGRGPASPREPQVKRAFADLGISLT